MSAEVEGALVEIPPVLASRFSTDATVLTEGTPLLAGRDGPASHQSPATADRPYLYAAITLVACFVQFSSFLVMVPALEVFRFVICQSYYAETGDNDLINLVGQFNGTVHERCAIDEISKKVANLNGLTLFIENFSAMLVVLPYGKLGDVYGRKLPMYISLSGCLFALVWAIIVVRHAGSWSVNTLLLPSFIVGFAGASPNIKALLQSMTCDCFSENSRLVAISWLTASLLLCCTTAPAVGSWLLQRGLLWPTYAGLACMVVATCMFFVLPETRPVSTTLQQKPATTKVSQLTNDEDMHAVQDTPQSTVRSLLNSFKFCFGALAVFGRGRNFVALGLASVCHDFGVLAFLVVAQFLNRQLDWSMTWVGYYLSAFNAARILVLLVGLPLLTRLMLPRMSSGRLNVLLLKIGFASDTLAYLGYAALHSWTLLGPILLLTSLSSPMTSVITALISTLAEPGEIGSMFAAFSVLDGVTQSISSPIMAGIYSSTISTYPGAVFLVVAAVYVCGLTACFSFDSHKMEKDEEGAAAAAAALAGDRPGSA